MYDSADVLYLYLSWLYVSIDIVVVKKLIRAYVVRPFRKHIYRTYTENQIEVLYMLYRQLFRIRVHVYRNMYSISVDMV